MTTGRVLSSLLVVVALAAGAVYGLNTRAKAATVFTVYMAADGSDTNNGLSSGAPVKTLSRVQAVLQSAKPSVDVEVRIKQGTYVAAQTNWSFFVPGHSVTFMPVDYQLGNGIGSIAGLPKFSGNNGTGWWFSGHLPSGSAGGNTSLRFYYLEVTDYSLGAISLNGGTKVASGVTVPSTAGMNSNTFFGLNLHGLGNKYTGGHSGYGAIDLVNSRGNRIANNHFVNVENSGSSASLIHGVYLANGSSGNVVSSNEFSAISGDPVRTRNASNDNDIAYNSFSHTGVHAFYSEWFCDVGCAQGYTPECASSNNYFHTNSLGAGYGSAQPVTWWLQPAGLHYAGAASACSLHGNPRLRTGGNT
jgi:hypothetical protein